VASDRQDKRDALAQSRGFRNYYDYRDWVAKEMGYTGYSEQRRARSSGIGLKGADVAAKRSLTGILQKTQTQIQAVEAKKPFLFKFQRDQIDVQKELTGAMAQGPLGDILRKFGSTQADINGILNRMASKAVSYGIGDPSKLGSDAYAAHKAITELLKTNYVSAAEFIKNGLPSYQKMAMMAGAQGGKLVINQVHQDRLAKVQKDAIGNLQRGLVGTQRTSKETLVQLRTAGSNRQAAGILDRHGAKAVVYADGTRRSYGDWASATTHALSSRLYNESYIQSAVDNGATKFIISDGDGCGLVEHNDPQQANGMIVDAETAEEFIIAHPHCVRTFEIYTGPKNPEKKYGRDTLGRLIDSAGAIIEHAVVSAVKASLVATAEQTLLTFVKQQSLDIVGRDVIHNAVEPAAQSFLGRFKQVQFPEIIDIATGKPKIFTEAQIAQDVLSYSDKFASGDIASVPQHVQYILTGTGGSVEPVPLGQDMNRFASMMDRSVRPSLNLVGDFFSNTSNEGIRQAFFDSWSDIGAGQFSRDKYLRVSLPGITRDISAMGKNPGIRLDLKGLKIITGNVTKTLTGERSNLAISPNALIRAGLHMDSIKGGVLQSITPSLRLNLPGPIHIQTTLNRATTDVLATDKTGRVIAPAGRVLSLSTHLNFVTPKGILRNLLPDTFDNVQVTNAINHLGLDLGANMRWDLRRLGLDSLSSIKDIRWEDIQRLINNSKDDIDPLTGWHLGQAMFRMTDITARIQMYNGTFFDFLSTLRLKFENQVEQDTAKVMWRLGQISLENKGSIFPQTKFKTQIFSTKAVIRESPKDIAAAAEKAKREFTPKYKSQTKFAEARTEAERLAKQEELRIRREEAARQKEFSKKRISDMNAQVLSGKAKSWQKINLKIQQEAAKKQEAARMERNARNREKYWAKKGQPPPPAKSVLVKMRKNETQVIKDRKTTQKKINKSGLTIVKNPMASSRNLPRTIVDRSFIAKRDSLVTTVNSRFQSIYERLPNLPPVKLDFDRPVSNPRTNLAEWFNPYSEPRGPFVAGTEGTLKPIEGNGVIAVNKVIVLNPSLHDEIRKRFVETGYTVRGTEAPINTFVHELGHHAVLLAREEDQNRLILSLLSARAPGIASASAKELEHFGEKTMAERIAIFDAWRIGNEDKLQGLISKYAAVNNYVEFTAELFLQAVAPGTTQNVYTGIMSSWLDKAWG